MDPVSQGVIGAAFSQSAFRREKLVPVGIAGALAGMAADLDILIRSSIDPLLFLEFHRQFTHSLIFVPVGALLVAACLYWFLKKHLSWRETYLVCFVGYATHALLDAFTSYGTQLLWPFSDARIAWNYISVIDPLFTVPLLILFAFVCLKRSRLYVFLGLGWVLLYMSMGIFQGKRALALGQDLALSRGHSPDLVSVKPSFGNLLLWKAIYEFEDFYYVDAIRLAQGSQYCPGQKIAKLNLSEDLLNLSPDSQQAHDIERFRKFSAGYLSYEPRTGLVIDTRYSVLPNEFSPLWGIVINPDKERAEHAEWWDGSALNADQRSRFLALLAGDNCQNLLPGTG